MTTFDVRFKYFCKRGQDFFPADLLNMVKFPLPIYVYTICVNIITTVIVLPPSTNAKAGRFHSEHTVASDTYAVE